MVEYALSFLEKDYPHMAELSKNAEKHIYDNIGPSAITNIGQVAEMITKKICTEKGWRYLVKDNKGWDVSQSFRINALHNDKKIIDKKIYNRFKTILDPRNDFSHPNEDEYNQHSLILAKKLHKELFEIGKWFSYEFADNISVQRLDYPGIIYKEDKITPEELKDAQATILALEEDLKSKNNQLLSQINENKSLQEQQESVTNKNSLLSQENDKIKSELDKVQTLEAEIAELKDKFNNNQFEEMQSQQLELIQDVKRMGKSIKLMSEDNDINKLKEDYSILSGIINQLSDEMCDLTKKTEFEDIKSQNLLILKNMKSIESEINDLSSNDNIDVLKAENIKLIKKIKEIEQDMINVSKNAESEVIQTRTSLIFEEINTFENKFYKYYPPSLEHIRKVRDKFIVFNNNEDFGIFDNLTEAIKVRDELENNNWALKDEIKQVSTFIYQFNSKYILKAEIKRENRVFGVFNSLKEAEDAELEAMNKAWILKYVLLDDFSLDKDYEFDL